MRLEAGPFILLGFVRSTSGSSKVDYWFGGLC
jgi:hypothetical protein